MGFQRVEPVKYLYVGGLELSRLFDGRCVLMNTIWDTLTHLHTHTQKKKKEKKKKKKKLKGKRYGPNIF